MIQGIRRIVPRSSNKAIKRLLSFFRKPELSYLELHLTDHCNLNCKGCGHYCPIAPTHYTDFHQHQKDLRRLSHLFRGIHQIRLMGGEPLLHPDAALFIVMTQSAFPKSDIRFATNGILLPQASQAFWNACRDTNTTIDLTVYPPLRKNLADYRVLCKANGVSLSTRDVEIFHAHFNSKGNSDKKKAFDICRSIYFCPFLRDGRLYTCATAALVHYFNERFGCKITADEGIDIHSNSASGRGILRRLSRPIDTCKWCSYDFVPFSWEVSNRVSEDWDTEVNRIEVNQLHSDEGKRVSRPVTLHSGEL